MRRHTCPKRVEWNTEPGEGYLRGHGIFDKRFGNPNTPKLGPYDYHMMVIGS